MRCLAVAVLILAASPSRAGGEFRWPDPNIQIPRQIQAFIVAECNHSRGIAEEAVDECIDAERYGYRAVVTMLMEEETGQRAAERYRICSGGLGSLGGKFHRRKAVCIGRPLHVGWRFEFMQKAALERDTRLVDARDRLPTQAIPGEAQN